VRRRVAHSRERTDPQTILSHVDAIEARDVRDVDK
jgi:hypothetical protein